MASCSEDFSKRSKLGKGRFGEMWRVRMSDGAKRVVKFTGGRIDGHRSERSLKSEADDLVGLDHESIVVMQEYRIIDRQLLLFMQFIDGQDLARLVKRTTLSDEKIKHYCKQICSALEHIHWRRIVHRNIKGSNIMIDSEDNAILTDFGVTMDLASDTTEKSWLEFFSTDGISSLPFAAPEVLEGNFSCKSDIWAFGCTVFQMKTGRVPYQSLIRDERRRKRNSSDSSDSDDDDDGRESTCIAEVIAEQLNSEGAEPLPEGCERRLVEFYEKCVDVNESRRSSARNLESHGFLFF